MLFSSGIWYGKLIFLKIIFKENFIYLSFHLDIYSGTPLARPHTGRPVNCLGHQVGRRVFWDGSKFFKIMSNNFKLISNTFFHGGQERFQGASPSAPLVTGLPTGRQSIGRVSGAAGWGGRVTLAFLKVSCIIAITSFLQFFPWLKVISLCLSCCHSLTLLYFKII